MRSLRTSSLASAPAPSALWFDFWCFFTAHSFTYFFIKSFYLYRCLSLSKSESLPPVLPSTRLLLQQPQPCPTSAQLLDWCGAERDSKASDRWNVRYFGTRFGQTAPPHSNNHNFCQHYATMLWLLKLLTCRFRGPRHSSTSRRDSSSTKPWSWERRRCRTLFVLNSFVSNTWWKHVQFKAMDTQGITGLYSGVGPKMIHLGFGGATCILV